MTVRTDQGDVRSERAASSYWGKGRRAQDLAQKKAFLTGVDDNDSPQMGQNNNVVCHKTIFALARAIHFPSFLFSV
jgi:hypothetical protein